MTGERVARWLGGVLLWAALLPDGLHGQRPTRPLSPVTDRFVEEVEEGLRHHRLQGRAAGADPWSAHLLEIDLTRHAVELALAVDQIIGQETPSSMVRRRGAVAGVNGGFSVSNDPWTLIHGDPNGFLAFDGVVLSEPVASRPALGICGEAGAQELRLFTPTLSVRVIRDVSAGPSLATGPGVGLNRAREEEDRVVYTPEWNATTLTGPGGVEVVVREGSVVAVSTDGSAPIPEDGFVLSATGSHAAALARLRPGDALSYETQVTDAFGAPVDLSGCDVTSAGPILARDGVRIREHDPDSYREGFVVERHPRTAVGLGADRRTLYLLVVDGRQPEHSVGATLEELTELLAAEGATTIYNLDGGGSSAMVLHGPGVLNSPSDGQERRRSDVLLVRPIR